MGCLAAEEDRAGTCRAGMGFEEVGPVLARTAGEELEGAAEEGDSIGDVRWWLRLRGGEGGGVMSETEAVAEVGV